MMAGVACIQRTRPWFAIALCGFLLALACALPTSVYAETKTAPGSQAQSKGVMLTIGDVRVHVPKGSTSSDIRARFTNIGQPKQGNTAPKLKKGYRTLSPVYSFALNKQAPRSTVIDIHVDPPSDAAQRNQWTVFFRTSKTDWKPLRTYVNKKTGRVRVMLPAHAGQLLVGYHKSNAQKPVKTFGHIPYNGIQQSVAATVQDVDTGAFVYRRRPNTIRSIASISKIATVYTFLQRNNNLERIVTYHASAKRGGATVVLNDGEQMTAKQGVMGALIPSANNMTVMLAQNAGTNEKDFVKNMNKRVQKLGLTKTQFVEPTGLDPRNQSTADNISKLARVVFTTYPELFQEAASTRVYYYETSNTHRGIDLYTTNKFDGKGRYTLRAFKTGYLPGSADRTFVALIEQTSSGKQIIVTLLGNKQYGTIFDEALSMADWAFANWEFPGKPSFK